MRSRRQVIGGLGNLMFKEAYLISQCLDKNISDTYVQSTKYWSGYENEIRSHFSEGITSIDKVALHIRRGDYLAADHFHVDLSKTDYYQRAVHLFPNEQFLVFCKDNQDWRQDEEDREWCKSFLDGFIPGRYEFQSIYAKEHEDMNAMASCKSVIMANSSFSWWGAWLNPHKEKRVVCPRTWFVDGINRTELLPEWILL